MKITRIRFDTVRGGSTIALAAPPSGDDESQLWQIRGDVIRETAAFPLPSVSAGCRISIIAELRSSPRPSTRVWLGATPHSPHVLGLIPEVSIDPSEWREGRCRVTFDLDASVLGANGIDAYHVAWRWHWRADTGLDLNEAGSTEHLLFVTITEPTAPWSSTGKSTGPHTTPWASALQRACHWGRGAKSHADAASRIVRSLFTLGEAADRGPRLEYNGNLETYLSTGLAHPRWFDCEKFLNDLAAGRRDITINCYEGAVIAMTFANLLGCALVPCVLEAECSEFQLNQLHPVGISSAESPPEFVLHVIALERKGKSGHADDLVYDAVLRIDQDPHPSCQPARFIIVDGIPLGTPTTPTGTGSYFPQLIAAGSIHRCRARTIGRPWVGAQPCQECVRRCPLTRYVRYLWALQSAKRPTGMFSASRTLRINGYDGREIYSGRPGVPRSRLPRHPLASRIDFVSQDPDVGRAVRVDWWTDDDPWITLSFMAELLAMSEIPVEPVAIRGGPAYTVPRRTSLLVLNEGAVIRFSSAGARRVDMVDLCDTAVSVL